MTYVAQSPRPTPSHEPDVQLRGDATGAFVWIGVVLLVLAVALVLRRTPPSR
jgi:hypothetical protein